MAVIPLRWYRPTPLAHGLLFNRISNIISKNSTSMFDIPSVFPQTLPLDEIHLKILQRNQEAIMRTQSLINMDLCAQLCAHLVQSDVFTVNMVDKIKVC